MRKGMSRTPAKGPPVQAERVPMHLLVDSRAADGHGFHAEDHGGYRDKDDDCLQEAWELGGHMIACRRAQGHNTRVHCKLQVSRVYTVYGWICVLI